jgi:hypothetical protein
MALLRSPAVRILLLLPLLAGCEGFRSVAGRVVDRAGRPVPSAEVRVQEDDFVYGKTRSDSAGRFDVRFFYTALAYRAPVRVEAPGYRTAERWVWFGRPEEIVLVSDAEARSGRVWGPMEVVPRFGAHYGVPLRFSGSAGAAYGRFADLETFSGVAVAVEGGEGGARGRAGYVRTFGRFGGELSASVLRTFNSPLTVAPRQTFAGAEARFFFRPFTLTVGGYDRIAGSAPGDERLFAVGVGLGY